MSWRLGRRALAVASIAVLFSVVFVTAAWAVIYTDTCNASGDACMWKHGPFGIPLAATIQSDNTYTDDEWPNTSSTLNDSASSLKNKFDVKDVIWFVDADFGNPHICVDHETGVSTLSGTFNDELTSHVVSVGTTC